MGRRRRRWTTRNIIATGIGFILVVILMIGLIPGLAGDGTSDPVDPEDISSNDDIFELTQAPNQRSFPAPNPEVSADRFALQSTGLFQIPIPGSDWGEFGTGNTFENGSSGNQRANLILNSSQRLSIAQAYVVPGVNYEDMQSVSDNFLTDDYFTLEWSAEYEKAEITERTVGETFLTIDFDLRDEDLSYFGRQISWLDSGTLYNLRFVVPVNNPDLLANLQSLFIEKFIFYPNIMDTPLQGWTAFSDDELGIMFKAPELWARISGQSGRISVYEATDGSDGLQVTVRQVDDEINIDDTEAMSEWLAGFRDGIEIFEGHPVQQRFGSGYIYSYTYRNTDGDKVSGGLALFPASDGGTNLVELRMPGTEINLLDSEAHPFARQILESVTLLAPDDFINIEQ